MEILQSGLIETEDRLMELTERYGQVVIPSENEDLDLTHWWAGTLTKYAWQFRYPGAPYEPDLEEGQRALALAREVAEAVGSRLPSEVQP